VIDLRRLREEPEYRKGIERKRVRAGLLDEVLSVYDVVVGQRRAVETHRAEQNQASKQIGKAAADERAALIERAAEMKAKLQDLENGLAEAEERLRDLALQLPNPADAAVPDGGEDDGEVVKTVGGQPAAPALDHAAFGEAMGFVDSTRGAEASGSRFAYILREAALLELALVNYAMTTLVAHDFTPVVTPTLVRERTMEEAGFFPTDRAQVYELGDDELFLVGTSEVPLSALRRGETFAVEELPARFAGFSSCFRREAGTYGKDTRGIFRVHQFDKVEMFAYCAPDSSWAELDRILAVEEEIVGGLGLPYHVVNIAAGDLGPAAAKKFDIEAWLPSEGRYRELTSCSNYTDYSARRLGTRVKGASGSELVHTLNGTACAISRTLVFLFEHYQDEGGAFVVPEVLRPYCGFTRVEPRA
jgi:seryl-tRNA synthetase